MSQIETLQLFLHDTQGLCNKVSSLSDKQELRACPELSKEFRIEGGGGQGGDEKVKRDANNDFMTKRCELLVMAMRFSHDLPSQLYSRMENATRQ